MTQAMPPTQPVLNSPKSTSNVATNGDSSDDFSDTFRNQLDGRATEGPSSAASDPAAASEPGPADASTEAAAAPSE